MERDYCYIAITKKIYLFCPGANGLADLVP